MRRVHGATMPTIAFWVASGMASVVTAPVAAQAPGGLTAAERLYGLSLIWREAAYNFPYFEHVPDLDWDSAYRAAVPRVLDAASTLEYYRALQRFTALLQDGHTRVHLPDSIIGRRPFSSPWVELEAVGGRPMVANVAVGLADSLPVGSEIVAVDGMAVDDYIDGHVLPWVFASAPHARRISAIEGSHTRGYGVLVGRAGEPVRVRAATPSGVEVDLTLARDRFTVEREWIASGDDARRPPLALDWSARDVAHLELNTFADRSLASRLDSVMPELRRARGIIIDLRRNTGGSDVVAAEVLARFAEGPFPGPAWRTRTNDAYYRALGSFGRSTLERALPPEDSVLVERAVRHHAGDAWRLEEGDTLRPAYEGERIDAPVIILVDRTTASAAENLLLRIPEGERSPDDPRFLVVGSPTAGSTGQPLVFRLPGGGSGQVVTRAVLFADGTPLVKTGVVPDVVVEPTIEDVRAGRDPALERAVELLRRR